MSLTQLSGTTNVGPATFSGSKLNISRYHIICIVDITFSLRPTITEEDRAARKAAAKERRTERREERVKNMKKKQKMKRKINRRKNKRRNNKGEKDEEE